MADVYRVGVAIGMTDNASQVISVLAGKMLGLNAAAKEVQHNLGKIRLAAVGLGGVLTSSAIFGGTAKLVDAGKELVHQQSLMLQAGLSQKEVAEATAAAWRTSAGIMGSSAEKNLTLVIDLKNRLSSMSEAITALPSMASLGVFLQNGTGRPQDHVGDDAARFLEQKGYLVNPKTHLIDPIRLESGARLIEAIAAGTRFKVGPHELLMFQQYARAAGAQLSTEGLIKMAPIIGASSSPSSVGTQLSSLQQQIMGGITTQMGAEFLEKLGILNPKKVHVLRGGHLVFDKGALRDEELAGSDPVEYINTYIRGGLLKHMGAVTSDEQTRMLMSSHLRSTVIGLLTEVVRSYPAFEKDAQNIRIAAGVNQYKIAQETDPTTKINNFDAAWHNLLTSLGSPLVTDATGIVGKFSTGINDLASILAKHPKRVEELELAVIAFGGIVGISGSLAIAALTIPPFTRGLGALIELTAEGKLASSIVGMAKFGASFKGLSAILAASAANDVLNRIDPNDKVGSFIDHYVPGASWLDDKFSYLGWGTSYEGQKARWEAWHMQKQSDQSNVPPTSSVIRARQDATAVKPADTHVAVYLDGKQIAANTQVYVMQEVQRAFDREMRASNSVPDPLSTPRMPGSGWAFN